MSLQKNLSNIMKAIHDNRNQTLSEFANELDISRSSLQDILNGTGNPRMDTVEHIAEHLGIDPLALLSCSYSELQFQAAVPLLQLCHCLSDLSEEKRAEFIDSVHKLMLLLAD